jgi:hypothetical protein
MKLSPEQIKNNWEKHLKIINHFITSPRKEKVLEMMSSLEDFIILSPASGKAHYHNAFIGGYIEHVNRVIQCALKTKQLWEETGADIDFTDEELVFSALFHDLGKIGDGDKQGYLPETSDWHKKNQGSNFKPNPELDFMLIQDRSLYLLQKYSIPVSKKEYLAIRLHDGVYDDANKSYFFSHNPDSKFKTNLVYILHQADFLASKVEYDVWKTEDTSPVVVETVYKTKGKTVKSSEGLHRTLTQM